jgi:hypothetical protein
MACNLFLQNFQLILVLLVSAIPSGSFFPDLLVCPMNEQKSSIRIILFEVFENGFKIQTGKNEPRHYSGR